MREPHVARTKLCPFPVESSGTLQRMHCVAGECALWEWIVAPSVKSAIGMRMPDPPTVISWRDDPGVGRCSVSEKRAA